MNIKWLKHSILIISMVLMGVSLPVSVTAQPRGDGGAHVGPGAGRAPRGVPRGAPRSAPRSGPRSGHYWGGSPGWWGLGLGLGLGIGLDSAYFGNPYIDYSYPSYYYPESPPVVIVGPPSQIISPDRTTVVTPTNPPPVANWYYCDSAKGYYPNVTQCPEPWRVIPAIPPAR